MPEYTYSCEECSSEFTVFLPMSKRSNPETEPCPSCGKVQCVHQMLGAFLFKQDIHGEVKHSKQMKQTLKRIKNANRGSNIEI